MKRARALRWFLFLFIVAGIWGWLSSGSPVYARLVYISTALLACSAVWTAFALRGISISREARNLRASMGDVFEERYQVINRTWPGVLWLEIVNHSPLPRSSGSASGSRVLTNIGAHQKRFYTTRTLLTRRGAYPLGPTEFNSGDPFGLFFARRSIQARDTLIVLPMTVRITTFPPPPGILAGGKTIRQKSTDVTPHAAGVREYVPGDPMKRIHWPSSAHRGRFMVKEFEQDPQADIWIFLDAQREVHIGKAEMTPGVEDENWWLRRLKVALPKDSFEYAVSAAASLASFFLSERRAVGLACAGGKLTVVSAERGERQMGKILETLAFVQPQGTLPIQSLVDMQGKLLPQGSGVVLLTASTRPELLLAAEDLQRRNLRPIVVLMKPETFGGMDGSEKVAAGLLHRNIPVCPVAFGDDLGVQLALPATYFQRPYLSRSYFFPRA